MGLLSDFTKVTDSQYTVNIYPSDIPSNISILLPDAKVLATSGEPVGEASVNVKFSTEKATAIHRCNLKQGSFCWEWKRLHSLMVTYPKVTTKVMLGTVKVSIVVGNDVTFTFDFDKIYSF